MAQLDARSTGDQEVVRVRPPPGGQHLYWRLDHEIFSMAHLDAPCDKRPGGRGFKPRRDRQHSFVEIDHEIFSTVILSLPQI